MKTKYAMMVTLKEARKIYQARAAKERKKAGFLPIQEPDRGPLSKERAKAIRDAVTLVHLQDEEILVC